MTDFIPTKKHVREVLLHLFFVKKSAAQSHRLLLEAYGESVPSVTTCRDWFRRFKAGDYCLEDKERTGQPKKFSDDELRALIETEPCQTLDELAIRLNVDRSTVGKRLHTMGLVQKAGNWARNDTGQQSSIKRARMDEVTLSDQKLLS